MSGVKLKIRHCLIKNFRGLEDISLEFRKDVCLIAGPNAVGKSTVLEAIRLNRTLLLSRYATEGQMALFSLGAVANPNQIMFRGGYFDFSSIARDPSVEILIRMKVQLDDFELVKINSALQALALDYLRGSMGAQIQQDPGALAQFLSSEAGMRQLAEARELMSRFISTLNASDYLCLGVEIQPNGQVRGEDAAAQIVCAFLERSLPPQYGLFSYFSADRALPTGEAGIQLGAGDADNQIKAHIAEPQIKFNRLKTSIANSRILNENLDDDFATIFDQVLPGKRLGVTAIGPIGNFRVSIVEDRSARPFDIDNLSSGEKGLILTFLQLRRAVAKGGIVLIDEPELHLNPGVCRKLLNFLIDHCIKPKSLQAIICTHSAQILNSAYEREDCGIHHLKSPTNATPIYRGDFAEMFGALGTLGVSPAESFFYESRLFVEGPHDQELLEEGFRSTLGDRCQISWLGGRKVLEGEIASLQHAEKQGSLDRLHCFILDKDRSVTGMKGTALVKVLQWDRYCFENYLLNYQVLYDVIKKYAKVDEFPDRGNFQSKLKELAMDQTRPIAARETYEATRIGRPGLEDSDLRESYPEMAAVLKGKLTTLRDAVSSLNLETWEDTFLAGCQAREKELRKAWDDTWEKECDGKNLLLAVCRTYEVARDRKELKKEIIRVLRDQQATEWQEVDSRLRHAMNKRKA